MTQLVFKPPVLLMETDVGAVPGGGAAGWVSGTIANLAASGFATIIFDLGADWRQYCLVDVTVTPVGPSSGLNPVQFTGSDTPAANGNRRRGSPMATGATTYFLNLATASSTQSVWMRPAGRYLVMTATNADAANALGAAAKVTLCAYPS